MTHDELQVIKARAARALEQAGSEHEADIVRNDHVLGTDVPALIAEVERRGEEIDRLKAVMEKYSKKAADLSIHAANAVMSKEDLERLLDRLK